MPSPPRWILLAGTMLLATLLACGSEHEDPAPTDDPAAAAEAPLAAAVADAQARSLVAVVLDSELAAGAPERETAARELARMGAPATPQVKAGLERIPVVEEAVRRAASLPGSEAMDVGPQLASLADARRVLEDVLEGRQATD